MLNGCGYLSSSGFANLGAPERGSAVEEQLIGLGDLSSIESKMSRPSDAFHLGIAPALRTYFMLEKALA